jgi:Glucodextranase, domain B
VLSNPLRRAAMLVGALSLLALTGPVASASAEVESSQITSPADPTYALFNETLTPPQKAFTVSGTTTGAGNVALLCYDGTGTAHTIVSEVVVTGNAFSVNVEAEALYDGPCALRAVPVGDKASLPPGASTPFQGPRIVGSSFEIFSESKNSYDYEFEPNSLLSRLQIESAGDCGLDYSNMFAATSLAPSAHLFDCNAFLYLHDYPSSGEATRSSLQIDGANAYSPATAHYLENNLKVTIPGAPQITATESFEPKTGLGTIHEVDPIVRCSPETVYPPTAKSCTSFVSTGVQLERTWQTSNADQAALMTDTWHSTDGAAHSLNALYVQDMVNQEKAGSAYELPGTSTFAPITKGQTVSVPAGAGKLYYKEDAETPNVGDGEHPQGAIIYDTPPNGSASVFRGSKEGEYNGFEMPYQRTIPVGGSYTIRMAFVQAYKLSEVESLTETVLASYPPTLMITSPANGATVSAPSITVAGTATDTGALASLTVNGQAVSAGTGGAWSTSVVLSPGANTIKVVATDQAGLSAEKSVSVTYTPPAPPAKASQVGSASGANGEVSFTIACTGAAGTSCEIESTASTVERTRNGRPIAVSARRHHHRIRSRQVTVGSSKLTIPAGERVTILIQLNAVGHSLLARFGALPVHLAVFQVSAGHRSTLVAQNLTVRPGHRRRHHHHHHH